MPEVGLVAWRKDLGGKSKDLMQRNGGKYAMIEVRPADYIDGVCSDNTFGIKRC